MFSPCFSNSAQSAPFGQVGKQNGWQEHLGQQISHELTHILRASSQNSKLRVKSVQKANP
jgi:hypothetical protein